LTLIKSEGCHLVLLFHAHVPGYILVHNVLDMSKNYIWGSYPYWSNREMQFHRHEYL